MAVDDAGPKCLAFSPDGRTLALGGEAEVGYSYIDTVWLWDVGHRKVTATLTGVGSSGHASIAFSPDGRTLAAGVELHGEGDDPDKSVLRLWDIR